MYKERGLRVSQLSHPLAHPSTFATFSVLSFSLALYYVVLSFSLPPPPDIRFYRSYHHRHRRRLHRRHRRRHLCTAFPSALRSCYSTFIRGANLPDKLRHPSHHSRSFPLALFLPLLQPPRATLPILLNEVRARRDYNIISCSHDGGSTIIVSRSRISMSTTVSIISR